MHQQRRPVDLGRLQLEVRAVDRNQIQDVRRSRLLRERGGHSGVVARKVYCAPLQPDSLLNGRVFLQIGCQRSSVAIHTCEQLNTPDSALQNPEDLLGVVRLRHDNAR